MSGRVSGIVFKVSLNVIRNQNTCAIPTKDSSANYFTEGDEVLLINGQAFLVDD